MKSGSGPAGYRGRIAPSPTGWLHVGHARTFWLAAECARRARGLLVYREDDLDPQRSRPEFARGAVEDLRWFGIAWDEGPDVGGPFGPYRQSERVERHRAAFERLREMGAVYPCVCSRRDLAASASAPHAADDEIIYSGACRQRRETPGGVRHCWRFRAPDGASVSFCDAVHGPLTFVAGRDFGDFVVWRQEGAPSYQLACVADDHDMRITEVVRGDDLLLSTARQRLLYEALGWSPPSFRHSPLVRNAAGVRLAKRDDSLSLRTLRNAGLTPDNVRRRPEFQGIQAEAELDRWDPFAHNPADASSDR